MGKKWGSHFCRFCFFSCDNRTEVAYFLPFRNHARGVYCTLKKKYKHKKIQKEYYDCGSAMRHSGWTGVTSGDISSSSIIGAKRRFGPQRAARRTERSSEVVHYHRGGSVSSQTICSVGNLHLFDLITEKN